MSALCIVRSDDMAAEAKLLRRVGDSMRHQGFTASREFMFPGGRCLWFETPGNPGSAEYWQQMDGGIVACVGTLFYRGAAGGQALRRLWHDFSEPARLPRDVLFGNYVAVVAKGERVWVFGDSLGMVRCFARHDLAVMSTSWLATVACVDRPRLDPIGAIDYVFSGSNHGTRTPLEGIINVDATRAFEAVSGSSQAMTSAAEWSSESRPTSFDEAVAQCADILLDRSRTIAAAFPGRLRSALSGGFDSRLILAALRATGAGVRLHVYGRSGDEDVQIARGIAAELGLELRHIDKGAVSAALPPVDEACLNAQCAFFDGIPTDGFLDSGADRQTRIEQSAEGALALNGGGGEILRNFFYLADCTFSARDIVRAFYSGFDARAILREGCHETYREYLACEIERQLGVSGRSLGRSEVELIYPLFRVRFWTSRNNSLAARSGHFLTPLVDPLLVRKAAVLPLAWKDYGRFESRMIQRLSPELARFPTSYGFTPEAGPDMSYRLGMFVQHRRPIWLRAAAVHMKRALGRLRTPVVEPVLAALFGERLLLDQIIDRQRLTDEGQLNRLLSLEWVMRRYGVTT